jgi:hypothetical protein
MVSPILVWVAWRQLLHRDPSLRFAEALRGVYKVIESRCLFVGFERPLKGLSKIFLQALLPSQIKTEAQVMMMIVMIMVSYL